MRFSLHTAPHSILSKYFQAHCIRTRVMTMNNFHVTILDQCLVEPIEPTPSESLKLSIIDRVPGLRHMVRSLHVFKHGENPAKVIKDALAKALVMYHPFAGRFVDPADEGELEVTLNCNGEGAWFVEAEANCSLEDVKYLDHPLLISRDELLPCPHEGVDPLNIPVMMQVTEFTCRGFVVGIISIHTIADGLGAAQFINAIGDIARGQPRPSVDPTWSRHLIPNPKLPLGPPPNFPSFKLQYTTFDLPTDYINQTKISYFEAAGHHCSTFDISIAKAWQARTHGIDFDPETLVHVCFFANTRHLLAPQEGYYGNCFYPVTVTAQSKDVIDAEIVDVVRLIRDAKARLPKEFARWANGEFKEDPFELNFSYNSLFVSDWTRLGFLDVDYGWGKPVHVLPFAYYDFMAVVIFGAPPAPKKGVRVMTQCVEKEHMSAFQECMKILS